MASDTTITVKGSVIAPILKSAFKTAGMYNLSIRLYNAGKPMLIEKKIKL